MTHPHRFPHPPRGTTAARSAPPAILALGAAVVAAAAALSPAPLPAQEAPGDVAPGAVDTAYVAGEYRVFTGAGEPASLEDVVAAMGRHDVVFIGETHDDPTGHALEAELLERAEDAYPDRRVALSLEFFQRDVQPILDEYLAGLISESAFLADSRPWPRYHTDYRPLVELAKEAGMDVIAANAPRRYVGRVTSGGREALETLPPHARPWLPPLPYGQPSAAYREQWIDVIAAVMEREGTKCGVPVADAPAPVGAHHNFGNQLHSQVLWDASMAYWIARYLEDHPEALVLHMVGGFHVARGTGIPEHLETYRPGARALIVMLRPVEEVTRFEPAPDGAWGDFVIQTDAARTLEAIECRAFRAEQDGGGRLRLGLVTDQAAAVLRILERRAAGDEIRDSAWDDLFATEGYQRMMDRERAMNEWLGRDRGISDESFRQWATSDAALVDLDGRRAGLAAWEAVDVAAAGARALAYLPEDAGLRATIYPLIREQTNSFVHDLGGERPSIFMYVEPGQSAPAVEHTLAHELHHIGISAACQGKGDRSTARSLLSGFAEGLAVLAAAGGPEGETHPVEGPEVVAGWARRMASLEPDMRAYEAFMDSVFAGELSDEEAGRNVFRFVSAEDTPQGAFYSLGWHMAATVERELGRRALVDGLCAPEQLLLQYDDAAARIAARDPDAAPPRWSPRFLDRLREMAAPR